MSKGSDDEQAASSSGLELVSDALHASETRTAEDAQREFFYSHPDFPRSICTPKARLAEERAFMVDELTSSLGSPMPDDGDFVLHDINGHIALATQGPRVDAGRTRTFAAQEPFRFSSLDNRLDNAVTAQQIGVLITEAKHLGTSDVSLRAQCAAFLTKCFAKRAALASTSLAPTTTAVPVQRAAPESICGFVFDAVGGTNNFAYPKDIFPTAVRQAPAPVDARVKQARVYVANTHASVHPHWVPSWLSYPQTRGCLALNGPWVALVDTIDSGKKIRFRVWRAIHLLCKRAKPPALTIECVVPPALGAIKSATVNETGTLCMAIFDTGALVASAKRTVFIMAVDATGPVFTCGLFVAATTQFIRLGTVRGTFFLLKLPSNALTRVFRYHLQHQLDQGASGAHPSHSRRGSHFGAAQHWQLPKLCGAHHFRRPSHLRARRRGTLSGARGHCHGGQRVWRTAGNHVRLGHAVAQQLPCYWHLSPAESAAFHCDD
jgi:hypothetical protein